MRTKLLLALLLVSSVQVQKTAENTNEESELSSEDRLQLLDGLNNAPEGVLRIIDEYRVHKGQYQLKDIKLGNPLAPTLAKVINFVPLGIGVVGVRSISSDSLAVELVGSVLVGVASAFLTSTSFLRQFYGHSTPTKLQKIENGVCAYSVEKPLYYRWAGRDHQIGPKTRIKTTIFLSEANEGSSYDDEEEKNMLAFNLASQRIANRRAPVLSPSKRNGYIVTRERDIYIYQWYDRDHKDFLSLKKILESEPESIATPQKLYKKRVRERRNKYIKYGLLGATALGATFCAVSKYRSADT